jgi:hypothetical protein
VTPCGAQVGGSRQQNSSSSELKNLASKMLQWLESARRAGIGSRGVAAAAVRQPAAAAATALRTSGVQSAAAAAVPAAASQQ